MNARAWALTGAAFLYCIAALGQGVQYSSATLSLTANSTQAAQIPANTTSTLLAFTVEGDTTGGNSFDVLTSDPGIVVSLILPSSVEVTSTNAASLGFTFTVVPNGTLSEVEIPSLLSLPGTHTIIQIPGGQPSGEYQIRANASNVGVASGIAATYFSSSTVGATVTTDAANYQTGGTVILSGLLFDGATPVTGATATAAISTPVSLASQATVGNIQQVNSQAISSTLTDYSYSASLTNTGAAVQLVSAQAQTASLPSGITVLNDTLVFGSVAANASVTSSNTITIERNPSQSFDPTTLQWNVSTPGTPVNVALADSGTGLDAAIGDGIYTGTFTPTSAGTYTALLSLSGTSPEGNSFSRMAATQFTVTQQLASFVSFADAQQSGGVTVTATVDVQTAGTYRLTAQLQASNQNTIWGGTSVSLSAGSQQIALSFANSQLFELGVNGPYERINALLAYVGNSGDLIADSRADAGPTAAYTLSSLAPAIYFTGTNSASGIVTGSGPTFDLLQVNIGVYSSSATNCSWSAVLTSLSGNQIDFSSSGGSLTAGTNSVTLNFNGNLIAQAANGPYVVTNAGIHCGNGQATASPLFQTQAFTASQFTSVTTDFSMAVTSTPVAAPAGANFAFGIFATAVGPFSGAINFGVSGLPTSVTSRFTVPTVPGFGPSTLIVATTSSTPAGSFPLTITGTSGGLSHSTSATLTITSPPQVATPTFSPSAGTYTSAQTVTVSTTTSGASIRYTTDGSMPSETAGTLYSGPIAVSSTTAINAIAYEGGMADSAVASATYNFSSASGNGYGYSRSVTIAHTLVPNTDQTNFPFLFNTTDTLLATTANGGHVTNASGYDIIFTSDAAGTQLLSFEIESYNPATGHLIAWVQIPTVSHSADTVIYMFYGNSSVATSQQNQNGVWNSNYAGVWHLPNGTMLSTTDSTSNAYNGTNSNASATTGQIDGAANFVAANNANIGLGQENFGNTMTVSAWFKTSASTGGAIVGNANIPVGPGGVGSYNGLLFVNTSNQLAGGVYNGSGPPLTSSVTVNDGQWHYAVWATNGTTQYLYLDGNLLASASAGGITNWYYSIATAYTAGWAGTNSSWFYFNGSLDEVRFSTSASSADWIVTEYNNQSSPSTFYTLGSESGGGGTGSITATGGATQSTVISTAFATALQATVKDANNNPVSGVTVTFTAPSSGATAAFSGSTTAMATTNSGGVATAPTLTANATTGSYTVTASVSGVATSANFSLTNTSGGGNGYGYSRSVTIALAQVPNTDQTNFPFLFNTTDPLLETTATAAT